MATEDKFPTIRDVRNALARLCELGLGDMPTQIIVVPASTILAAARVTAPAELARCGKPPLMIEFGGENGRMSPTMVSVDYLSGLRTTPPLSTQ